jgi:hypothetical protein
VSHFPTKLWSQSTVHTVAVGASGAAWVTPGAVQKRQFQEMSWTGQPLLTQTIEEVLNRLNLPQSIKVQWVAAPSLAKHWLQQVPDQIQSLSELHTVAVQRAQQLFGSSASLGYPALGSSWVVSAEWDASRAFLCTAMPSGWHVALTGQVGQPSTSALNFSATITSPLHLVLSRFKQQVPSNGWLAVAVANTLYVMYFKSKSCLHFRSLQLKVALNEADIQDIAVVEWQRDMLRTQQKSDQLHWLNMMPTAVLSNAKNALLKPIRLHSINAPSLLDIENNDISLGSVSTRGALNEVKLAAWCAFLCTEGQQ